MVLGPGEAVEGCRRDLIEVDLLDRPDGADLLEGTQVGGSGLGQGGGALGRAVGGDLDIGWGWFPEDGADVRATAAATAAAAQAQAQALEAARRGGGFAVALGIGASGPGDSFLRGSWLWGRVGGRVDPGAEGLPTGRRASWLRTKRLSVRPGLQCDAWRVEPAYGAALALRTAQCAAQHIAPPYVSLPITLNCLGVLDCFNSCLLIDVAFQQTPS